jgi:hypothetical protein
LLRRLWLARLLRPRGRWLVLLLALPVLLLLVAPLLALQLLRYGAPGAP